MDKQVVEKLLQYLVDNKNNNKNLLIEILKN